MSVTGVALTCQRQMQWRVDTRRFDLVPPPGAERLPVMAIVHAAARTTGPEAVPTTVALRSYPAAPAAVAFGAKTPFVNPYTGEVFGERTGARVRRRWREVRV